ncbi:hypothetical protein OROHE_014582 [Orobanche hederae]
MGETSFTPSLPNSTFSTPPTAAAVSMPCLFRSPTTRSATEAPESETLIQKTSVPDSKPAEFEQTF